MARSSRPFLPRRQAGVRDIAIEPLLLVLLRAVRGDHQVADLGVECRGAWPGRIDHATSVLPADGEVDLHRRVLAMSPASGMVMVKLRGGGHLIPSIAQRPPSSGRTRAVTAASPSEAGQARDRPGETVVVVLAGDPPRQVRELDRRPEQAGKPVLQLLLKRLRLRRTDVVGACAARQKKQQAERNDNGTGARPGPPRLGLHGNFTA